MAALEPFDAGTIEVDGFRLEPGPTPSERALSPLRPKVALVFQQHGLFEHLDALGNVTLAPVHVLGSRGRRRQTKARALLESLGVGTGPPRCRASSRGARRSASPSRAPSPSTRRSS